MPGRRIGPGAAAAWIKRDPARTGRWKIRHHHVELVGTYPGLGAKIVVTNFNPKSYAAFEGEAKDMSSATTVMGQGAGLA